MADLVFIGGIGKIKDIGGELSKNKLITGHLKSLGLRLSVIDTYRSHKNPLKIWSLPFKLAANPSAPVIFSSSFGNIRLMSSWVAKLFPRRRLILWVVGGCLHDQLASGQYSVRDLKVFDAIFVQTQTMCDTMRAMGLNQTVYLPNFKDMSLSDVSCTFEGLEDTLRCVFFSRINSSKGVRVILDALQSYILRNKKIIVDFYGPVDDDFKSEFFSRIEQIKGTNYCGLLNFFDGSGQKTLAGYHLALFPTFWRGEGFPGVIVDSFSIGLPILASDWQHNATIVTGDLGFLCSPGDVYDFAQKLADVYLNRAALSDYSKRCKRASQDYDIKRLIDQDFVHKYLHL